MSDRVDELEGRERRRRRDSRARQWHRRRRRLAFVALLAALAFALVAGCAPRARLVRVEYGPLGLELETWRLTDGTCERRAFVGPYFYRSIVPCPEK